MQDLTILWKIGVIPIVNTGFVLVIYKGGCKKYIFLLPLYRIFS